MVYSINICEGASLSHFFNTVREKLMKKYLLALATALMLPVSAFAFELGNTGISIDNEVESSWSVDNETYGLTLESGVTMPLWILEANVNADFNIKNWIEDEGDMYQGLDLGVDYNVTDFMKLEVDTGLDTDWEMEDVVFSATVSF